MMLVMITKNTCGYVHDTSLKLLVVLLFLVEQDVVELDVAVHDPPLVEMVYCHELRRAQSSSLSLSLGLL